MAKLFGFAFAGFSALDWLAARQGEGCQGDRFLGP